MRRFASSLRERPAARVFALDHEAVQLDWVGGHDQVLIEVDGRAHGPLDAPGALTVPLAAAGSGPVHVAVRSLTGHVLVDRDLAPLAPPPGPELYRFATISDMHVGTRGFDLRERMREQPEPVVAHWERCTVAALDELAAWGAQRLVVKGDITHGGERASWSAAAAMLGSVAVPIDAIPGNHDAYPYPGHVDPYTALDPDVARITPWVEAIDVPGLRIVLCNTTHNHRGRGRLGHLLPELADLAADARRGGRAVLVVGHHHVDPRRVPVFWPRGVAKADGEATLEVVRRANPAVAYVAGHTHRHRRRLVRGVPHIEVGSPKDHPGTWAGYVVHEGGLVQTVRRVQAPDCVPWTEQTRAAALGAWQHWSPGHLDDRCFALDWGDGPP